MRRARPLPLAALACLLLTSAALVDELSEFRTAFRRWREPLEQTERRQAALDALAGLDSAALAEALLDASARIEEESLPLVEVRHEYLADQRREKVLERRLELEPLRVLADGVQGRTLLLSEPEALELCLQQALARDELPMSLRFALVEHTAPLEARGAQLLAEGWRREREPSELAVRLVAAGALGVHAQALGPRVLELLQHQRDDLRSLAADTLAKLAWAPALEPLVLSLARAEGRSKRRIARALHVLTGVHAGASPSAWRRWFDQEGAAWVAGEHELGGHEDSADSPAGAGRYHGIVIVGERVLFVLDRSKSMSQTVATGAEEGETRMQRALEELIATLGSLPEHMQFGVVVFAGRVTRFQPGLVSASAENIAAAQAWVTELELELGTAVYDALESAFQIAGHPPADDWHALGVDTMFLLTDGRPVLSGGKNDNLGRIRADLRRWNLLGRVVVHTIGLGDNVPKQFMRRLAQENGGTFVHERSER